MGLGNEASRARTSPHVADTRKKDPVVDKLAKIDIEYARILNTLLRVISGIGEEPRMKVTPNPIATSDHNPMLVCLSEFIIKKHFSLRMEEFVVAVSHKDTGGTSSTRMLCRKILELIW